MPRVARGIISGTPYHIIHRGNNRQRIFFYDNDYRYLLSLVGEAKEKYACKLYSYAIMPNHVHFILESPQISENLAKYIKLLAQKYSQYINKKYKRTGSLWEGKFRSLPISTDNYLLACSRYVEMNPVRANIVKDPGDYAWSSHRYKAGYKYGIALIDQDPLYMSLGKDIEERQKNYRKLFKESMVQCELDSIRAAINKGGVFGNAQFKGEIETFLGRKLDIRGRGRPKIEKAQAHTST